MEDPIEQLFTVEAAADSAMADIFGARRREIEPHQINSSAKSLTCTYEKDAKTYTVKAWLTTDSIALRVESPSGARIERTSMEAAKEVRQMILDLRG